MPGPFDVTTKHLVALRPADWLEYTGGTRSPVELLSVDLATITLEFRFRVLRAWQQPIEAVLTGGLATLPMAPLADVDVEALPGVIHRMEARIAQEASPTEAATLWTATYVLMGLRYSEAFTTLLLQGVRAMKESVTYQAILREGREEGREMGREEGQFVEARRLLLRLGEKRLGACPAATRAAVEAIPSLERLEALTERLLDVETWNELLAE
jgi:hypothetical protein